MSDPIPKEVADAMEAQSRAWLACVTAAVSAGCTDYDEDGETRSNLVLATVALNAAIRRALDEQIDKAAGVVEGLIGHVGDAFGRLGAAGDRALEFAAAEVRKLKGGGA